MEKRAYHVKELRLQREEGKAPKLSGYAAVFNSESVDLGDFTERIAQGAFAASLGRDVRALVNHDPNLLLGRTKSGTLRLFEDEKGLGFENDLPDNTAGRDVTVSVERGDIDGMSFAFDVAKGPDGKPRDQWAKVGNGKWLRTLLEVILYDVSPVTFPAYPSTEVALRAATDAKDGLEGLKRVQAEEQGVIATARAAHEARERRINLIGRGLGLPPAPDKAASLKRFLEEYFSRTWRPGSEARDASFEKKISAVWSALYALLGDPWPYDGPGWYIIATFPDRVIVETSPGKLFAYPITIDASNTVTVGEPAPVEVQYVPITAGGAA